MSSIGIDLSLGIALRFRFVDLAVFPAVFIALYPNILNLAIFLRVVQDFSDVVAILMSGIQNAAPISSCLPGQIGLLLRCQASDGDVVGYTSLMSHCPWEVAMRLS